MSTSGEAAEEVVRLSLEGVEVAAKITGSAAKEIAALLYAALKNADKNKVQGRQRLTSMLRSGKELTIFSVKEKDMKLFVSEAKRYGVVYCVLRNPKGAPNGECEIMVRAEDAAKINRIVENIKVATVTSTEEICEAVKSGTDKSVPEKDVPEKSADDRLLDEMMEKPMQKEQAASENPTMARTEKSPLSEPSSMSRSNSAEGASKEDRPSVREELRAIRNEQKQEAESAKREDTRSEKPAKAQLTEHHQPEQHKSKTKKTKER